MLNCTNRKKHLLTFSDKQIMVRDIRDSLGVFQRGSLEGLWAMRPPGGSPGKNKVSAMSPLSLLCL